MRVLIVDGDPSNQYLLANVLRVQGWTVVTAKDGVEALEQARVKKPSLVISEAGMTGMNGFDLCRAWQANPELHSVPFVFYSENHTRGMDVEMGLGLGARAYLIRPMDPARLLARLKSVLETPDGVGERSSEASVTSGNPGKAEVTRDSKPAGGAGPRGLDRRAESWETRCRRLESEVDERRRTETELRAQARLLEEVPGAVVVLGASGQVQFWNEGASKLFGWSTNEAVGASFAELSGAEREGVEVLIRKVGESGEWRGEMDLTTPRRRTLALGVRASLLRDEGGRPSGVLLVGEEVSRRRQLEEQVLRAERLETFAALASGVAHEINNTLTPLLLSIPSLRPDSPPADLERAAGVIQSGVRRVASAIRPLMALGLGVGGDRIVVALRELLKEVEIWLRETSSNLYALEVEIPANLWNVVGDVDQLRLAIRGFCMESRQSMPGGGRLRLVAENVKLGIEDLTSQPEVGPGAFVQVRIEDSSAGLPPREGDEAAQDGDRLDAVGAVAVGAAVARRYGGFLEARAEPGQGSRVSLVLPAIVRDAGSDERQALEGGAAGQGELILVVDDEVAVREFSRRTLERYGYQAIVAGDGAEGLVQFSRHRSSVRLVVSDINMPVLDGVMFARAFRRMDRELPLLIWSGLDERGRRADLQTFGVRQFLLKPLSAPDLLAAVGEALASKTRQP